MSRYVPLTTLRDRVITLCDLSPTLDTTTSPTAAAMLDLLQVSASLLSGHLSSNPSMRLHFADSIDLTTVAGISSISLPTDASEVLRVSWLRDASTDTLLSSATIETMVDRPSGWVDSERPIYRVVGNTIELYPTPAAAHSVRVYYSTGLYPSSISSQVWCMDGWDQFITLQTCCLIRARQQRACPEFEGPLVMLVQQIKSQNRDRGIRVCRDVRGSQDYVSPLWGWRR